MPYIAPEKRGRLDPSKKQTPTDAGELNYFITKMCRVYAGKEYNYSKLNEIMGVLECAKMEFYRRLAVPYEEQKIKENGDLC